MGSLDLALAQFAPQSPQRKGLTLLGEPTSRADDHEALERRLVRWLILWGHYNIRADDLEGFERPPTLGQSILGGYVPDVMSVDTFGTTHIFEVETADSLHWPHTAQQWRAFAHWSVTHGSRFSVVVPSASHSVADALLRHLSIVASIVHV